METTPYSDVPTATLQRQADKLIDKIDALNDDASSLDDYLKNVREAQKALPKAPSAEAVKQRSNVVATFDALKGIKPDADVGLWGSPGLTFADAVGRLRFALLAGFTEVAGKVIPSIKSGTTPGGRTISRWEQLANDAAGDLSHQTRDPFSENMPQITALWSRLTQRSSPLKRHDVEQEILNAQDEITKIENLVEQTFRSYSDIYRGALDAVEKRLVEEGVRVKAEIEADKKQLVDVNKVIQSRVTIAARQSTLTNYLILTEALMIGVIAFAIWFLKRYPEKLAITVVQERTLGDLLGMGLLLITIIFLATGTFVDPVAIVTLLGTIAGYIFGRRASAAGPSAPEPHAAAPLPAPTNLQQTKPATPGQIGLSVNPVSGAVVYRWYAKPKTASGGPTFRQQTTAPHIVLTGFQAGEEIVVAVSATNGHESPLSVAITVTVT